MRGRKAAIVGLSAACFAAAVSVARSDAPAPSTTLVSVRADGGGSGDADSGGQYAQDALSDDGRLVVFQSDAGDLVAGDDNTAADVFVRDLTTVSSSLGTSITS